jgi:hypothetical protein
MLKLRFWITAAILAGTLTARCKQQGTQKADAVSAISSQVHAGNASQAAKPADQTIATWRELKNSYGWSIRFPRNWTANAIGDEEPATYESPDFAGPNDCYKQGLPCAGFQIDAMPWQQDDISRQTPKEYLGGGSDPDFIRQGPICLDGHVGYQVFYLAKNIGGWSHPEPVREIAVKHNGKMLTIIYSENAKDNEAIRSPQDWKLAPVFEQILSTFRFTDDKREDCK